MSDDEHEADEEQQQVVNDAERRDSQAFASFFAGLLKSSSSSATPPLRIFEQKGGEYFSAHGADAESIADEFFNTREVLKYSGDGAARLASVSIRPQKLETILKHALLQNKQSVEMYAKDAGTGAWALSKRASPGNLQSFEDLLFHRGEQTDNALVMAARLVTSAESKTIGAAFADASARSLGVCEFIDSDRFAAFESLVVQRAPRECLLCADAGGQAGDLQKLREILDANGVAVTEVKRADFTSKDVEADLRRLLGTGLEQHQAQLERAHAITCLPPLLRHLQLLGASSSSSSSSSSTAARFKLHSFDVAHFMRLDKAAVRALNLFPSASDSNRAQSLLGLLNKCRTAMGQRLLSQWLKQPLLAVADIERRLNFVEAFVDDTQLRQSLQEEHLKRVPDLDRLAKKFQRAKGTLQESVQLYQFIVRLPVLCEVFASYEGTHKALLQTAVLEPLQRLMADCAPLETMIEQTIDLSAAENHEFCINPSFSPELTELHEEKTAVKERIDQARTDAADDLGGGDAVKLQFSTQAGWHMRVSRKDEKLLRGAKGVITLETRKDGVRFTTAELKQQSRAYLQVCAQYESVQSEIVAKALEIVASYTPVLEEAIELFASVDCLVAFAAAAVAAPEPYVRPTLLPLGSGRIELHGARHPCLEAQDAVAFIANDIELVAGQSSLQIVTGPNMGGKSTYIRSVGVVCLMAQIGCFVPCARATVTVVDAILARVGAGDSTLRGVSTFMAEMLDAASILKAATKNSLLIVDELGRGTSTYDGFGLAYAISEHIAREIGAFALFATHFHELTALADAVPSAVNRHVTAHTDEHTITMLYKIKPGACDRSFGIHVAEMAQFPPAVVAAAKRKAAELEDFTSAAQGGNGDAASLDTSSAPSDASKRARSALRTAIGAEHVSAALSQFRALDASALDDAQLMAACARISAELQSSSAHPSVRQVFEAAASGNDDAMQ